MTSTRRSLPWVFVLLSVLIGGIGVVASIGLSRASTDLTRVGVDRWRIVRLLSEAADLSSQNSRLNISLLLIRDLSVVAEIEGKRQQNTDRISTLFRDLAPLLSTPSERALYGEVLGKREKYLASYRRAISLYRQDVAREQGRAEMVIESRPLLEAYHEAWQRLVDFEVQRMDEETRVSIASHRRSQRATIGFCIVSELLVGGVAVVVIRRQRAEERRRERSERSLQDAYATLEQKVLHRTKEIEDANAALRKTHHSLLAVVDKNEKVTADLRANEDRVRKLLLAVEQAAESIVITDTSGKIEYVNPAFERVTGYSLYEVAGQTPRVLKSSQQRPEIYGELWRTIASGEIWSGRLINRKKDGSILHEDVTISPVREAGRVVNFVAVNRDVTREVALESRLMQAEKLEAVGRLAAGVAHEINTPTQFVADNTHFLADGFGDLSRVLGCLQSDPALQQVGCIRAALDNVDLPYLVAEIPKAIEQSLEGLARIAKIVGAMKDFSHPGGEERTPFDINRAIDSTVTICRNEWKHVADLQTEFDQGLPHVPIVVNEINQVFLNLIVNAAHAIASATDNGARRLGKITISTRCDGSMAEVRIRDDGTGIPSAVRPHIFEPFFTTKPIGKGTGQGLALSRSIVVDRHQGELYFETEDGTGTTFVVRLPLVLPAPERNVGGHT